MIFIMMVMVMMMVVVDEGVQQFPRYFVLCLRFATLRGRSLSKGAKGEC
jgi:hypothetical protein